MGKSPDDIRAAKTMADDAVRSSLLKSRYGLRPEAEYNSDMADKDYMGLLRNNYDKGDKK